MAAPEAAKPAAKPAEEKPDSAEAGASDDAAAATDADGGAGPVEGAADTSEETCGFCKFMKAGPCGTVFAAWEACVDKHRDAGDDFVESCLPQTRGLKECMEANPEYYGPLLHADEEDEGGQEGGAGEEQQAAAQGGAASAADAAASGAGQAQEAAASPQQPHGGAGAAERLATKH